MLRKRVAALMMLLVLVPVVVAAWVWDAVLLTVLEQIDCP